MRERTSATKSSSSRSRSRPHIGPLHHVHVEDRRGDARDRGTRRRDRVPSCPAGNEPDRESYEASHEERGGLQFVHATRRLALSVVAAVARCKVAATRHTAAVLRAQVGAHTAIAQARAPSAPEARQVLPAGSRPRRRTAPRRASVSLSGGSKVRPPSLPSRRSRTRASFTRRRTP
jgi:hypothetical protein